MDLDAIIDVVLRRGQIGPYKSLSRVGEGGFGIVLRATDELLERTVALKFPRQQTVPLENLLYEARLLASLAHPNILVVYTACREACTAEHELAFIVTEYAAGGNLADHVQAKRLRPSEVVSIMRQVTDALSSAHKCGIIHRDIKPENILIEAAGCPLSETRLRVADFGIGVRCGGKLRAAGTPPYMAPEAWLGGSCPASDVYAVGVMAFLLLTGRFPFEGPSIEDLARQHLEVHPPTVGRFCPSCPADLQQIVGACLEKDPRRRPADGSRLLELLGMPPDGARTIALGGSPRPYLPARLPRFALYADDILNARCDAVAYSANNRLEFGGGLAKTLLTLAGPELQKDAESCLRKRNGVLPPGEVVVTGGHDLRTSHGVKHVLHAATLYWNPVKAEYFRQTDDAYLEDISRAAESTCRTASGLLGIKRLGLTVYGARVRQKLFPNVSLGALVAANVRGIQRFFLAVAGKREATAANRDWQVVLSTYSRTDPRISADLFENLEREVQLVKPVAGLLMDCNAEALVISANNWLVPGSGSARAAFDSSGPETQAELMRHQPKKKPLARGAIVTVSGGGLTDQLGHRKHLIHAVTTWYQRRTSDGVTDRLPSSPEDVYLATTNALQEALRLGVSTVGLALMCARPGYHAMDERMAPLEMTLATVRAINDLRPAIAGRIRRIEMVFPNENLWNEIGPLITIQ